jgi:hypothetical protein
MGAGLGPMPAGTVSPPAPWWLVALFTPIFIVAVLLALFLCGCAHNDHGCPIIPMECQ